MSLFFYRFRWDGALQLTPNLADTRGHRLTCDQRASDKRSGGNAPVTEGKQLSPHLSSITGREITTPSGKSLTLMSPAYVRRPA